MEIHRATLKDLNTISALNVHVQRVHAEALPEMFKLPETDAFSAEFIAERLADPDSYFFIAIVDAQAIGYVYAHMLHLDENPYRRALDFIEIDQISVQPQYQRKGFGGALVQQVRELAREKGIDTITLSVWFFNDQSRNFFRGQGFEVFNERMWLRKVN